MLHEKYKFSKFSKCFGKQINKKGENRDEWREWKRNNIIQDINHEGDLVGYIMLGQIQSNPPNILLLFLHLLKISNKIII